MDVSQFFLFENPWRKRKQAIGPEAAMMDAHMLSLSAWARRLLCDKLSVQHSGDGVGTPPGIGLGDAADVFCTFGADFCVTLEHLLSSAKNLRKYLRAINQHTKISASINQEFGVKIPPLWKMKARGTHKKSETNLFREKQRGGENSGEGKHTINPLPKNGFGPPHL